MAEKKSKTSVNEIVTERILDALKQGVVPWYRPWRGGAMPKNLVSKRPYRGINVMLLGLSAFESPYWVTYKQATELGGQVRKGEHSTLIVFFTTLKPKDKDGGEDDTKRRPFMMRYYRVFNTEQVDGIEAKVPDWKQEIADWTMERPEAAALVDGFVGCPQVRHEGFQACYSPLTDVVKMPPVEDFLSEADYYGTLFHELTHSTGHASRLNRFADPENTGLSMRDKGYAREELTAEMGAAFMLADCGLADQRQVDNSAAYIASWMKRLGDDPSLVVAAAQRAQKAYDHMTGAAVGNEATVEMEVAS